MATPEKTLIEVPFELFEQENVDTLKASVQRARANGAQHFVLNFQSCQATSAYALNVLLQLHDEITKAGGSLEFISVRPAVKEILANLLLDRIIKMS